ncbi:MAG: hypothetical protein KJ887_02010 [Candidatus Omnitrophica bacterium]|nr:hypothetical protein [Candidatus Omnitrophota bacterium]MBU1047838.1 hypothetical protein [Candidatus Omnitrophota bacterium]MBU1630518.1 hypothetical protein [Candidatus Omnitrophota bacterium]MBU1766883.1 hypothetical protein [Candidatus Omnitrophota bacterium]MBU1888460.1 hypothetical protein [Candidatus Omnitrophota bacterium]
MRQIVVLPSFERLAKKLSPADKEQLIESLEKFNNFILSGDAPVGLGFKKINHNKYEFRAGLRLRVVVKAEDNTYYLVLVGNHDDVKRYLRKYR